jgi:hypothetical protein
MLTAIISADTIDTAPGIIAAVEQIAEPVGHSLSFEKEDTIAGVMARIIAIATTPAPVMMRIGMNFISHPHVMNPANRVTARVRTMKNIETIMSCAARNVPRNGMVTEMSHCHMAIVIRATTSAINTSIRLNITIS